MHETGDKSRAIPVSKKDMKAAVVFIYVRVFIRPKKKYVVFPITPLKISRVGR